jgi:soluble lytic murein transglycosylase
METAAEHNEEAHLYLAWSLEALGNVPAALQQIDVFIDAQAPSVVSESTTVSSTPEVTTGTPTATDGSAIAAAARGTIERGKMQARAGLLSDSAETYAQYVAQYPEQEDGPYAAWWSAAFAEQLGDSAGSIARYQLLAELYPEHDDADEALFLAGYLAHLSGDGELARTLWEEAATTYPNKHYGAAALIWLLRTLPKDEQEKWLEQAAETSGSTYFPLRLQDITNGIAPFEEPESRNLVFSARDQQVAETWLRQQLDLLEDVDVSSVPDMLVNDGRLARGKTLWQLGLRQEAKTELESLRRDYTSDPLASYQLALIFRDLGLYRSSILAAESALKELETDVLDAPRFLAGLAFPTYYADLITAEAEAYGYDPLLQFALVRQESLFESFATSGAAAQGLSQVIPDTGAYIAQRLGLQDYVNEDLYRPYIGIAFGAFYLDQQLKAFDGDVAAALSAYNAGPGNAARWYEEAGGDVDLYVVTVDFSETQHYIERIYAGQAIYRHIYGDD